jgi:hypothetical protein
MSVSCNWQFYSIYNTQTMFVRILRSDSFIVFGDLMHKITIFIILIFSQYGVLFWNVSNLFWYFLRWRWTNISLSYGGSRAYLLTLPLFTGVSRVRALSPAWTGSHAWETLISRTHLFLPHVLPPIKKSSTIKTWPTFCDQYFWKFPIWNSCTDEKRREIRMVKVFKWCLVIDLFDTFTGKLDHGD